MSPAKKRSSKTSSSKTIMKNENRDAGVNTKQASGDAPDKRKKGKDEEITELEVEKSPSVIAREEAECRAIMRRMRFKRRWPAVTKTRLKTKPWHPPPPPQKPPPVVVDIPEMKYHKWIPPYLRRRRRRPRRTRIPPEQMTQPLPEVSKLKKIWHNFMQVDRNKMMLQGSIACNSKKYSSTTCGAQTGCIALMTRALLQEKAPALLTRADVDELISAGDRFYKRCMIAMKCYKGKPALELNQLLPSFFLHDTKYTVKLQETERGLLAKHPDNVDKSMDLMAMMEKRVGSTYTAIMSVDNTKHFLVWGHPPDPGAGSQVKTVCYIFDPHMLDEYGNTHNLCGAGAFLRYAGVNSFVVDFLSNHGAATLDLDNKKAPSPTVTFTNIEIVQTEPLFREPRYELDVRALTAHCHSEWQTLHNNALIELKQKGQYPMGSLSAVSLATSRTKSRKNVQAFYQKQTPKEPPPVLPVAPEKPPPQPTQEQIMELRGENFFLYCPKQDAHTFGRDDLIPLPKSETVLHSPVEIMDANFHSQYRQLDAETWILRGTRHMASYRYQTFKWYTGVPCCVSAIATLRRLRARAWCEDTVDETLDLGYNLYRESLSERGGPIRRLVLGEIKEVFTIRNKEYKHKTRNIAVWGRLISNNPKVFDLCRGIETFFKEADTGLLQIPGEYEVCIWNEGGKYYVYHPWPADASGHRVGLQDGGKACLLYFTRVTRLCEHFMESVADMKRKPFSISDVKVSDLKESLPEPVNNMKPVAGNRWVVRGHFHEGDERFPEEHRGRQATPTSIAALALAHVLEPDTWTGDDIDQTLVRGDALYQSTMENLEKLGISLDSPKTEEEGGEEEEETPAGTLAAADVLNRFKVSDTDCIETEVMDSTFTGSLNPHPEPGQVTLKAGLAAFFKENKHGVFTARGNSTAIWKQDNHFYFFDPHPCDENGLPSDSPMATAVLVRVKGGVSELADVLLSNLPPGTDDSYNISPVLVTATKLNPEIGAPETKLESKAFEWIRKGTAAIMMGPRGENSAIGKATEKCFITEDTAGRTLALPAAAAFAAATESVPPPHMHLDHMFNFLDAGADYYLNHVKKTGRKDLNVEDLTEKFEMGANTFSIELDEPTRLPLRLPDEPPPEGEEGGGKELGGEEEEVEQIKEMKDLLFKMWYDNTKPTTISLLLGDYHQLGVWMAAGGKVVAFDPAPTMMKGLLTSHRIVKGDELRLQRIKDEMSTEGDEEAEDEEAGGEGEEKPEPEPEPVPPESCPVLIVAASPGEFIDKLVFQGGLDKKQAIAPYKLYPVKVTNELTATLKEKKPGAVKGEEEEEDEGAALLPALEDDAVSEHMTRVSRGVASVRGQLAQNENFFMEHPNRDNQDAANSVMGIVVEHIEPYQHWKPVLIDAVLKYGDRLHTVSLPNASAPPRLKPEELITEFHVTNFNVRVEIEADVVTGDYKAGETGSLLNFRRGLMQFFESHKYGVICAKGYCVGVWRGAGDQSYVLWEPHAVGPAGRGSPAGAAGLVLFAALGELADVLKQNVEGTMTPGNSRFYIATVKVFWEFSKQAGPVTPQGAVPDEGYEWKVLTAFVETARGRTILRGSPPADMFKFSRDCLVQSSCGAVVATCLSHVRRPHLWTRRTVDEAVAAAGPLFYASIGSLGYEFRPGEDILLPLQVLQRFVLGVNYVRFSLEEIYSGRLEQKEPSAMTLRSALERFFERHTHGIVWCLPHAVAVWRVRGAPAYYMMEPHACGAGGLRLDGQDNGAACLLTFTSPKLMAFAYLQNYPPSERLRREFQVYAMRVSVSPIRRVGLFEPPLVRPAPAGAPLVPATSKVGVDGAPRRAAEAARKHPPGSATCLDAQRAADRADREQTRLKGQRNAGGWLVLNDGSQFMSAQHSIACRQFSPSSRGYQALACAVMGVAMSRVEDVCRWCGTTLDDILVSGDQLYQDSYLHYRPTNKILSIEQILRKFYTPGNCVCRVVVYRARQRGMVPDDLLEMLMQFFREEKMGVLVTYGGEIAVALFRTCRGYYTWDPQDRDRYGRAVPPPCAGRGRACFSQYPTVKALADKLAANIPPTTRKSQGVEGEKPTDDKKSKPEEKEKDKNKENEKKESKVEFAEEVESSEPTTFAIYGMDVSSLRRLNKHER